MSERTVRCGKAFEVDLPAFLAEGRRPEFTQFLDHYPCCPECSAEVRAWTEVHHLLEAGGKGADPHPPAELLLAFEDAPGTLPPPRRAAIEAHVGRCRSCADELRALRRMDVTGLEAKAVAPAGGRRPVLGRLLSGLRGLALHPAFAYALVLLLLYPAVKGLLETPPRVPGEPALPGAVEGAPPQAREADRRDAGTPARARRPSVERPRPVAAPAVTPGPAVAAAGQPASATAPAEAKRSAAAESAAAPEPVPAAPAEPSGPAALPAAPHGLRKEAAAEAPPSPAVLALRQGQPADLPQAALRGPLTLRVALPEAARGTGAVEVRVLDPAARREMRERFRPSPGQAHLDVRLPAEWLSPGTYRVELSVIGAGGAATRVADFAFTVR